MSKENHVGGANMKTVLAWILGVATIALTLLVMLILFGNLQGNVGFGNDSNTITVTNETLAFANVTGYTLSGFNSSWSSITPSEVFEVQDGLYNVTVPTANVSASSVGILTNGTDQLYANISISYTYVNSFASQNLLLSDAFIGNYTKGVANTGEQFPVVGTIIGVALLLLILIGILVFAMVNLARVNKGSTGGAFG